MQVEETWVFQPRDTCYFGGAVPFAARETAFLASRFPPSPTVIQGAVRTALLLGHGTGWDDYYEGRCNICGVPAERCAVLSTVGPPDSIDHMKLDLRGPFLYRTVEGKGERLYPAPADLLVGEKGFVRLEPGEEVETDMGRVRLPIPSSPDKNLKSLQGKWITETGLIRHLSLAEVERSMLVEDIFSFETRVGVGRSREKAVAEEGLLYSLNHVRMREDHNYAFGVRLRGIPANAVTPDVAFFGGERRLAYLERKPGTGLPMPASSGEGRGSRFRLVFLTPAKWDPPRPGEKVSLIPGLSAELVSACLPKAERLGGWWMAAKRGRIGRHGISRPVEAVVSAGSVFFFQSELDLERVVELLHDQKLGRETRIGFGHVAVGAW